MLRPIHYRDKKEWTEVRSRNSDWLAPWEASNPAPGGRLPNYRQMVASLNAQARQASALPFVITERIPGFQEPRIVGQLTVSSIMWGSAMTATLGYWVDQARAGRGIAPTAVAMATDHCFKALGLHRMEINIRPENGPSLRVVEKLGFRDEGRRERFLHINGEWADHRSFALTSEEVPGGLLAAWLRHGAN
ncbi:GNAT family N-acetyltransferase [Arthrobacter bambusae]|uniref:GNAT family N-acetyltransferase n=1 Tax=Arthrobacter TaxID=1663 RepID=UPI001559D278|nr:MULTISPECIES: GNAT family protein [Arthrobacter]MCI0142873.1 GNAT family N-acetyltransferase [Arthrobacter bambusae]MDQ0211896.1 ribosomal-protein-alanine N-acetyltransferase [Arthrobacter bambusae]MDQ0236462.1 ribosomal-protein-alanine N-acetyltransferase [Arthrobacter bambusae]UYY80593.1 GNAT family N-acetyltransferase [Arthrobacter sp. YA7-1]